LVLWLLSDWFHNNSAAGKIPDTLLFTFSLK
jgi:hypothetical protein